LYKRALERDPNDGRAYNNMGAIFSIQAKDDEPFKILSKSLQLDPFGESTLVNLASYHTVKARTFVFLCFFSRDWRYQMLSQSIGFPEDLALARQYYQRAYAVGRKDGQLIREAIVQPMIIPSIQHIVRERVRIEEAIDGLLKRQLR
jgi:tetratricopeptide (TPR) repeat protein